MEMILVRHGQSEWQVNGESAGLDSPLTQLGELQAHRLGEYLAKDEHFDALYASDYQRAHQTAGIVSAYLKLPVRLEPGLREFSDWEAGWAPLAASMWQTGNPDEPFNPGYAGFRSRVLSALQQIVAEMENSGRVLIVAHGGTIGTVLRIVLGSDTPRLYVGNTAIQHINWDHHPDYGATWALSTFNKLEHLPLDMRTL